jgi:hypothetical protein
LKYQNNLIYGIILILWLEEQRLTTKIGYVMDASFMKQKSEAGNASKIHKLIMVGFVHNANLIYAMNAQKSHFISAI